MEINDIVDAFLTQPKLVPEPNNGAIKNIVDYHEYSMSSNRSSTASSKGLEMFDLNKVPS